MSLLLALLDAGGQVNAATSCPASALTTAARAVTAAGGASTGAPRSLASTVARTLFAAGGATTSAPSTSCTVVARPVTAVGVDQANATTSCPSTSLTIVTRPCTATAGEESMAWAGGWVAPVYRPWWRKDAATVLPTARCRIVANPCGARGVSNPTPEMLALVAFMMMRRRDV